MRLELQFLYFLFCHRRFLSNLQVGQASACLLLGMFVNK
jgi:hypothetical protein